MRERRKILVGGGGVDIVQWLMVSWHFRKVGNNVFLYNFYHPSCRHRREQGQRQLGLFGGFFSSLKLYSFLPSSF